MITLFRPAAASPALAGVLAAHGTSLYHHAGPLSSNSLGGMGPYSWRSGLNMGSRLGFGHPRTATL